MWAPLCERRSAEVGCVGNNQKVQGNFGENDLRDWHFPWRRRARCLLTGTTKNMHEVSGVVTFWINAPYPVENVDDFCGTPLREWNKIHFHFKVHVCVCAVLFISALNTSVRMCHDGLLEVVLFSVRAWRMPTSHWAKCCLHLAMKMIKLHSPCGSDSDFSPCSTASEDNSVGCFVFTQLKTTQTPMFSHLSQGSKLATVWSPTLFFVPTLINIRHTEEKQLIPAERMETKKPAQLSFLSQHTWNQVNMLLWAWNQVVA